MLQYACGAAERVVRAARLKAMARKEAAAPFRTLPLERQELRLLYSAMEFSHSGSREVKAKLMIRQDGVDFICEDGDSSHRQSDSACDATATSATGGDVGDASCETRTPDPAAAAVPRIQGPDSPVPILRKTVSDGVCQMMEAVRSRKDLACQSSVPVGSRKSVTFTKSDQDVIRPPRICRTPTPYARFDSTDVDSSAIAEEPEEPQQNSHPAAKQMMSAPGHLENDY